MMENSMFYVNFEASSSNQQTCMDAIRKIQFDDLNPVYLLKKPIIDKKVDYSYQNAFVILMSKHKIIFVNFGEDNDLFNDFQNDFIDDIGYIAKKYEFLDIIGRPRTWRKEFVIAIKYDPDTVCIEELIKENELSTPELVRRGDILISLATGSINEANRLGFDVPDNVLDQIKRKIILFDGEQTKFIFDEPRKKRITIQGLAGTGKTELLLHKIKELYTDNDNSKIVFTCHNVILANSLRKRVPEFFNFMKVEEQIQWEKRLWVMRSWGSRGNPSSGVYSYICDHYQIPFNSFSYKNSFDTLCKEALSKLNEIVDFKCCFDYVLIDESQDFSEGFFSLCEKVSEKCLYVAGDIFQDIFENKSLSVVNPDFLLNKCYRTDPRTLMGAHAIGMGLFDKNLRWLKDDEWEACGYDVKREIDQEKEITMLELRRKPLKRFEDIDMSKSDGITVIPSNNENYLPTVLMIIDSIIENNQTVIPDDIGIIFMENVDFNFKLASSLQDIIKEKYDWNVNIGYETKEKKKNTIFISNRNNVKGLEFPFVICIMKEMLTDDFLVRNSIYMMLTRSFITSYLVIPLGEKNIEQINRGIEFINRNGYMNVKEPSEKEKSKLANAIIGRNNIHKSLYDMAEEIMDEIGLMDRENRKKIHDMTKTMFVSEVDRDRLQEFIRTNCSMME